jgi:hypothetical protein
MKNTILPLKHSMHLSPVRLAFMLIPLALACFALLPTARAVCQEGCLANENTVLGEDALISNTTGIENTAIGDAALVNNTFGSYNTATGALALNSNTGSYNTAIGESALFSNTTGYLNTASGFSALYSNTTGHDNTANGEGSLYRNTTGTNNTAVGVIALYFNTTGNNNIAVGESAGVNLTTGSNNIDIGSKGQVGESKTIRIGKQGTQTKTVIAGISGATVPVASGFWWIATVAWARPLLRRALKTTSSRWTRQAKQSLLSTQ